LTFSGHEASVNSLAFSADGKRLASCSADGAILWDVAGRQPLRRFVAPRWILEQISLSPDGTLLAARGDELGRAQVRLWETATGKELTGLTWEVKNRYIARSGELCFSRDGRSLLATESYPPHFRLYSM